MQNYYLFTSKTKIIILLAGSLSLFVLFFGLMSGKAFADHGSYFHTLSPNPGVTPGEPAILPAIKTGMEWCSSPPAETEGWGVTYPVWASNVGNPAALNYAVTAGQTSITLDLNIAMATCLPASTTGNAWGEMIRDYILGSPTGEVAVDPAWVAAGITYAEANLGWNGQNVGAYGRGSIRLVYTPIGGFTTSGWYYVSVVTSSILRIYHANTGTYTYICGADPNAGNLGGFVNPFGCLNVPLSFPVYINVNSPPVGVFTLTCDPGTGVLHVGANASDPEGQTLWINAYVNPGGSSPPSPANLTYNGPGSPTINIGTVTRPANGGSYTVTGEVFDGTNWAIMTGASAVCPVPMSTIQGRVYNAFQTGTGYNAITVSTCTSPASTNTLNGWSGNGHFEFSVPQGTAFCVSLSGLPAGATAHIRPSTEARSYAQCGAGAAPPVGDYCQAASYPTNQIAGQAVANGFDRASDLGYDFVIVLPPQLQCTITSPAAITVGEEYRPSATVTRGNDSTRAPYASGLMTISGPYSYSATGDYDTNVPSGTLITAGEFTPAGFTPTSPGAVVLNGTVAGRYGTTEWWSVAAVTSPCSSGPGGYAGDKPYLKAYGGEVWAGGGFDDGCVSGNGNIDTFATSSALSNGETAYRGASAQFTVTALMQINQFYSAGARQPGNGSTTYPPKGLTFANNTPSLEYGGGFGSNQGRCVENYFDDTKLDIPIGTSLPNFTTLGTGQHRYDLTGDKSIGGITILNNTQVAIYIEGGDVFINNDIVYSDARTTYNELPHFALIVKGNIYIANNVKRLDGLFVAQPNGTPNSGRIFTCAAGIRSTYTKENLYDNCGGKAGISGPLVFNGAVVAQQVRLLRTSGNYLTTSVVPTVTPVWNPEIPDFNTGLGTGAAEIFNYTPEVYIGPSALRGPRAGSGGPTPPSPAALPYDSVISLPPIF